MCGCTVEPPNKTSWCMGPCPLFRGCPLLGSFCQKAVFVCCEYTRSLQITMVSLGAEEVRQRHVRRLFLLNQRTNIVDNVWQSKA